MIKVYVAGPYNADNVMGIALNMHNGIKVSTEMRRKGFSVYCPWDDFLEAIFAPDIPVERWRESSMEHLRDSNAILVVDIEDYWRESAGTADEIAEAGMLKTPVFFYSRLEELLDWSEHFS